MSDSRLSADSLLARTLALSKAAWLRLDSAGVVLEASAQAEEILGWPLSELVGSRLDDPRFGICKRDGRELSPQEFPLERLKEQEVPVRGQRLLVRWPGSTRREIAVNASLLPDGGAIFLVDDVTEAEGARRDLLRSEERLSLAISTAGLGLWEADLASNQILCDSRLAAITGYERFTLPTSWEKISELIHPEDLPKLQDAMVAHLRGDSKLLAVRMRVQNQQGAWLTVDAQGRVIERGDKGRARRVVGTLRNVTAEIKAEQNKRLMTENLARLSRMESLSVLAGGVAHDYNNLLMAMLTGLIVAKDELEGHPAVESLDLVEQAANKAKDLTRQLLAFSGRGEFVVKPVDLHAALENMQGLFRAMVSNRVRVELHLDAEECRVVADQTQLQQVVMNLVVNAGQATPDEGGRIRVTTETRNVKMNELKRAWSSEQAEPGKHVLIHVIDQGVGIDEATLSRIFDPFFTTRQDGHGLGLAASLGIVQGHRGFLMVESTPGKGTHFTVGLPLTESSEEESSGSTEPVETPGGGLRRILVVDDQPLVRRVTSRMLRRLGWEVWEANSGEEALARYVANPNAIAVLLADMRMPGMSGADLLEAVRRSCPEQPVILMSGFEPTGRVGALSQLPRTAFLAKPFFQKQLLDCLSEVTGRPAS